MTISFADLRFLRSERMTDNSDGGGRATGTMLVSGVKNQVFDDISDVDRAAGDVSIRKAYGAVASIGTEKYLDAGVVILREPADPKTSVLLFSTGSFYDERAAIQNRLEQTITRGPRYSGLLYGQHLPGQRAILIWQRPEAALPAQGARFELIAKAGSVEQYSEFIWVTRVLEEIRTYYDDKGSYPIRVVTCELAEALTGSYNGTDPNRVDVSSTTAVLHETRYNAEAVPVYGIRPMVEAGHINDYAIKIDSLYSPLLPTALTETALPDAVPGGESPVLAAGNSAPIQFTTTAPSIKPGAGLYCGTGFLPGSLSIAVSSSTITDRNGVAWLGALDIGSVDYGNGVITWNTACPDYGTSLKTIALRPAGRPIQILETAAQVVTAENRGFVWVITLTPIPAPGTLRVAYRVNNQWYVLLDRGDGTLTGSDSRYGSGTLLPTGTVTMSCGELPDVGSSIVYTYGTPALYNARGGSAVDAPIVRGQTAHPGVAPGTARLKWLGFTLTDDGHGHLTGVGGVGEIRYATGEWWARPSTLPPKGTAFTMEYEYGAPLEVNYPHPARAPNGHLAIALPHQNLRPGSVEVEWNMLIQDFEAISLYPAEIRYFPPPRDPIRIIRDDGSGGLPVLGGTPGTVNYATGTVDWIPDITLQIPKGDYTVAQIGTTERNGQGAPVYRNAFVGFTYQSVGAYFPSDETGWVKVRYRVTGGDTAATETVSLDQLEFDLTKDYAETIIAGSTRFRLAGSLYTEVGGQIYRDPSPDTGAGTLSGSLDPVSGRVRLASWAVGANALTLESLVTSMDARPIEEIVFRTPVAPIKSGSFQLRYTTLMGVAKTKNVGSSGVLEDADCLIQVDGPFGFIRARFGLWKNDADLTPEERLQPWYDPDARVLIGGVLKIWRPKPALSSSLRYNAVAQTMLPPDSRLLGLNAARLPPDGKALIFNTGRLILVHHTVSLTQASLSPTQIIDCGRPRLYRATIADSTNKRLPYHFYEVQRETGLITMSATLDLTGYTGPYTVSHTIADLARLVSVDISGKLTLNIPLSHDYPAMTSRVSSVLYVGTLQARVTALFAQSVWTGAWSDTRIGDAPLAQYNDIAFPLQVSNLGAYPDRYLVQFTSASEFRVIGENLGLIGIGNVNENCSPLNPLTGAAYFSLDHRGWGAGWSTGNCLRFAVVGALYPIDLIRAVQPSPPTTQDIDTVELLLLGNTEV